MPKQQTNKQIEANRKNAKLGGVKTSEGKEKSKLNALKHGILLTALTPYEETVSIDMLDKLNSNYEPVGVIENTIVERMAIVLIRLSRAVKAEREFMRTLLEPDVREEFFSDLEIVKNGYKATIKPSDIDKLHEVRNWFRESFIQSSART